MMPSQKFWAKRHKNKNRYNKPWINRSRRKSLNNGQNHRNSARHALQESIFGNTAESSTPRGSPGSHHRPRFGQALTKPSSIEHGPSLDIFRYDSHPSSTPQSPFSPPYASSSVRQYTGSANYEVRSLENSAPMMAPGHEQQQQQQQQGRSHQPTYHRSHQQQHPNPQRSNLPPNGVSVNGEQRNPQARDRDVERDQPRKGNAMPLGPGPMQSHIQVAKPYVFQQAIEGCLKDVGVAQAREDNIRLAGVQWIDSVRRALKLPVRTFDTAVVYYHKFRLVHSDGEYSFVDAAAAALFAACKIEDTLKKSRDILCAAHNLKASKNEHLSPDDTVFEAQSRVIIGLERLMLEASSFDFRNRHPQTLMIKLAKYYSLGSPQSSPLVKTAYAISLDLYRTFAPLKQNTATMAFACLDLAIRLHNETGNEDEGTQAIVGGHDYDRWGISRAEVLETLLDLLEVYAHYRGLTVVGLEHPIETFLNVQIPLNEERVELHIPRFTEYVDMGRSGADPAGYAATVNGVSATSSAAANGTNTAAGTKSDKSPTSPSSANGSKPNGIRQKAGERGREGTVRFMLNPDRERQERLVAAEYQLPSQTQAQLQSQPTSPVQSQSQSQSQTQTQQHHAPPSGPSHGHGHNYAHNQTHGPVQTSTLGLASGQVSSGHTTRPHPPTSRPGSGSGSSDRNDRFLSAGPRTGGTATDRDRDRDRNRERDRDRDRDRDVRDRDRDGRDVRDYNPHPPPREHTQAHTHTNTHTHTHPRERERERDRDRDRDWPRERERERDTARDRDRERDRDRDRDVAREKDRERERDREREKDRERESNNVNVNNNNNNSNGNGNSYSSASASTEIGTSTGTGIGTGTGTGRGRSSSRR